MLLYFFLFLSATFAATNCTSSGGSDIELISDSSLSSTELFISSVSEIAPLILNVASVPVVIQRTEAEAEPLILISGESIQILSPVQISGAVVFQSNSEINFFGSLGREENGQVAESAIVVDGNIEIQPGTTISMNFFSEEEKGSETGILLFEGTSIVGAENLVLEDDNWEIVGTGTAEIPTTISVLFVGPGSDSGPKQDRFAKYLYIILPSVFGLFCLFLIFSLLFLFLLKKGPNNAFRSWIFFAEDNESKKIVESVSYRTKKHGVVLGATSSGPGSTNSQERHYSVNIQPGRGSGSSSSTSSE